MADILMTEILISANGCKGTHGPSVIPPSRARRQRCRSSQAPAPTRRSPSLDPLEDIVQQVEQLCAGDAAGHDETPIHEVDVHLGASPETLPCMKSLDVKQDPCKIEPHRP